MFKKKLFIGIILTLSFAVVVPFVATALIQDKYDEPEDGTFDPNDRGVPTGGTTQPPVVIEKNYRTCPGDPDFAKLIEHDGYRLSYKQYTSSDLYSDERTPSCDFVQFRCLFGIRVDCGENPQGYQWKCVNYDTDRRSGAHVRDIVGTRMTSCQIPKKKTTGKCSTTRNQCESGEIGNISQSDYSYSWTCYGTGGGQSDTCSEDIPQLVNAKCGRSHYECSAGSSTNPVDVTDKWTWTCAGAVGGKSLSCTELKPFKGACGTEKNTCTAGSSTRQATYTDRYAWSCVGVGVNSSINCSQPIVAAGVCSTKKPNECEVGIPADYQTNATGHVWQCVGLGGGNVASCTMKYQPTAGICSSSHYRCSDNSVGINPLQTINEWRWDCPGKYGGKNTTCSENMGIKKGECSSIRNECYTGTPAAVSEDGKAYKWTCIGPNKGGDSQCLERKKQEGICGDAKNTCIGGDMGGKRETKTMSFWKCSGVMGGSSESCSLPKDGAASTTAICAASHYSCNAGKATNKIEVKDKWTWVCDGNGGKNATCVEAKPISSTDSTSTCAPNDTQCLIAQCKGDPVCLAKICNGNKACENALLKCNLNDVKCISNAMNLALKKDKRWGPGFKENNGSCSKTIFSCERGTPYDNVRDLDSYKWKCLGKKGGNDAVCKVDKPKDAICSKKKHNACEIGTPIKISETKTIWNWTCNGIGGGKSEKCSMDIVPLNGICSNVGMTCDEGKSSKPLLNGDWWEWSCSGSYGGTSTKCYKEVKGQCNAKHYSCAAGKPDSNVESEIGWSWKCRGANGDLTVSCFESKNIKPINVTSTSTATTTTATTTASTTKQTNQNNTKPSANTTIKSNPIALPKGVKLEEAQI